VRAGAGGTAIGSGLAANAERQTMINIDAPLPGAQKWLADAAHRLTTSNPPENVTDAARWLKNEMDEAWRRRQVKEAWVLGTIKNYLIDEKFWPRTRPQKRRR
jgi:hypothetical protein